VKAIEQRLINAYVHEVLSFDAEVSSIERESGGSPLAGVIAQLELGVLGNGCRGTKGVGHRREEREDRCVNPAFGAKYRALRGDALRATDAIMDDGQGFQIVWVPFDRKLVECDLPERIAFRTASEHEMDKWRRKIWIGDAKPAIAEAARIGNELLQAGAAAWWSAE
jgi:hypothetical protein